MVRYAGFVARMERSAIRERSIGCTAAPDFASLHPGYEERRKRNAGKRGSATAASCDAARALRRARSSDGVPPRFSPKGVFHPKDSAPGQASWDVVCTGVTRLRLSQSRDAPPAPVMVPGDMMPKPPGSGLQIRPRAPHPPHLSACLRKASFERAGCALVAYWETKVNTGATIILSRHCRI